MIFFFQVFSIEHSKQLPMLSNYIKHHMNNSFLDISRLDELFIVKKIPKVPRFNKYLFF